MIRFVQPWNASFAWLIYGLIFLTLFKFVEPLNALAISRFAKFTPCKSALLTEVYLNTPVDNNVGLAARVVGTATSALVPVYFVRSVVVLFVV